MNHIVLTVPTEPSFATSVRMLAASLAVTADMDVDEVEDVRMAAEEGFVIACASGSEMCTIDFCIHETGLSMHYELTEEPSCEQDGCEIAHALLLSLCETYEIKGTNIHLNIVKL